MSLIELAYAEMSSMTKVSLPLADYVGKNVRFAFCYEGTDGDMWLIDAVKVGMPTLDVSYMTPTDEQFYGFGCDADFSYFDTSIAIFPYYSDIVWTNMTGEDTATYNWIYDVPSDEYGTVVEASDDQLVLKYYPYYGNDDASRENYFSSPILEASAPGASDGVFSAPVGMYKAGGKAEYSDDGETYNAYGLLPFDIITEEISYTLGESPDGETADVPIFGYSSDTKDYWTDYTFQGDPGEDDSSEVTGYVNYIVPGDKPMVVSKLWTNAIGRISDTAEFKASFYALSAEGEIPEEPFVSATCKGSDALITKGYSRDYLTIPFTFDEPVVLEATDDTPGYIVVISGFNEGGVEYFAPIQSLYPNKDEKNYGWLRRDITWNGETHVSYSPLSYYQNANGDMYCSFAINLDGYYPWLTAGVSEVAIGDGETKTVALDSYYEGSELSVKCADGSELPSWLKAEVSGRYNKTVLTLTSTTTSKASEVDLVVSAAGVKAEVKVNKVVGSAINAATSNATTAVKSVYNLNGQRVSSDFVPAGLYIQLDSNGRAHKVVR